MSGMLLCLKYFIDWGTAAPVSLAYSSGVFSTCLLWRRRSKNSTATKQTVQGTTVTEILVGFRRTYIRVGTCHSHPSVRLRDHRPRAVHFGGIRWVKSLASHTSECRQGTQPSSPHNPWPHRKRRKGNSLPTSLPRLKEQEWHWRFSRHNL